MSDFDVLNQKSEVDDDVDGKYEALVVEMSLRSSTYATMALRELTRMDTGKTYQSQLTDQHQAVNSSTVSGCAIKRCVDDVEDDLLNQPKLPKIEMAE